MIKSEHHDTHKTVGGIYATAETLEVRAKDGSIMTPAGTVVLLGEEDAYASCIDIEGHKRLFGDDTRLWKSAYNFKTVKNAVKGWKEWDGHPWYYKLKPGSLRIWHRRVEVTTTTIVTELPYVRVAKRAQTKVQP